MCHTVEGMDNRSKQQDDMHKRGLGMDRQVSDKLVTCSAWESTCDSPLYDFVSKTERTSQGLKLKKKKGKQTVDFMGWDHSESSDPVLTVFKRKVPTTPSKSLKETSRSSQFGKHNSTNEYSFQHFHSRKDFIEHYRTNHSYLVHHATTASRKHRVKEVALLRREKQVQSPGLVTPVATPQDSFQMMCRYRLAPDARSELLNTLVQQKDSVRSPSTPELPRVNTMPPSHSSLKVDRPHSMPVVLSTKIRGPSSAVSASPPHHAPSGGANRLSEETRLSSEVTTSGGTRGSREQELVLQTAHISSNLDTLSQISALGRQAQLHEQVEVTYSGRFTDYTWQDPNQPFKDAPPKLKYNTSRQVRQLGSLSHTQLSHNLQPNNRLEPIPRLLDSDVTITADGSVFSHDGLELAVKGSKQLPRRALKRI